MHACTKFEPGRLTVAQRYVAGKFISNHGARPFMLEERRAYPSGRQLVAVLHKRGRLIRVLPGGAAIYSIDGGRA